MKYTPVAWPDLIDVREKEVGKEFYFFDFGQVSIMKSAGNSKLATITLE